MYEAGFKIAHFKIINRLGVGGMGEVYLANDTKLNRKVALKVLPADIVNNKEHLDRFIREAKTVAQVSHPNVMSIYDIGSIIDEKSKQKINYLVMEYIEGDTLADYLRNKSADIGQVIRISEKIASGLSAAHKLNIVHRDIKNDNIIVDNNGEPKILDFGLAKPLDPIFSGDSDNTATVSEELTKTGKIMGTVSYMSPEQARGEAVDIRSDIFSFGILFYRMVTGEFPFTGETQVSTLAKILETKHEPPSSKNQNIPPELERIIDKCLQKNKDDRYQDTRDLVVDLRNLRRQFDSGTTDSISGIYDKPKIKKSFIANLDWRMISIAVVAILVAIFFMGGFEFSVNDDIKPTALAQASGNSLAILGFVNKTGDSTLDWLETGLPEILLTDLAQSESIHLISSERVFDCFDNRNAPHSFDECVKAAQSIGAKSLLSGSYFKYGDKIRIDARLEDLATGRIILAEKVVGHDPFPLLDSLIKKISVSLNIEKIDNQSVTTLVSSSPEAYRFYLDGLKLLMIGELDDAIVLFNNAIEIDSTFAMPYLRIGMAYMFQGKSNLGLPFIKKAKELENNLPIRDKNLLDVYADVWINEDYGTAFTKMETFVSNYPDDKEARSIYAILVNLFKRDTIIVFAHFDTVLKQDPSYNLALSNYSEFAQQYGDFEKAEKFALQEKKYYPEYQSAYVRLGNLYREQGRFDEAIEEYEKGIEIKPSKPSTYRSLSSLYLKLLNFEKSSYYLDQSLKYSSNDDYALYSYYGNKSNLSIWQGKLIKGMDYRFKSLESAIKTKDSLHIVNAYSNISTYYYWFGMKDSSMYYSQKGYEWTKENNKINYPIRLVIRFPETVPFAQPLFEKAIDNFKARVPSDFWVLLDKINDIFVGYCEADTTALIKYYKELIEIQGPQQSANDYLVMSFLMVETGQYDEAINILSEKITPEESSVIARHWLRIRYHLGRAYEGVGNTEEAIKYYQLILKYWANTDIELKEIADTKKRLAKLTG